MPELIACMSFVWKEDLGQKVDILIYKPVKVEDRPSRLAWLCEAEVTGIRDYVFRERMWGNSSLMALCRLLQILRVQFEPFEGRIYRIPETDIEARFELDSIFGSGSPAPSVNDTQPKPS